MLARTMNASRPIRCLLVPTLLALSCGKGGDDTGLDGSSNTASTEMPWSAGLPASSEAWSKVRGLQPTRAIVHLHSAWSHDACDGEPLIDGVPDADCVQDLRDALCTVHVDAAFLTDHPSHAADQEWDALFHAQQQDTWLEDASGEPVGIEIACEDGHRVRWYPGIEDELMPVGLRRHAGDTPQESSEIYDSATAEGVQSTLPTGATVLLAHTEGRQIDDIRPMMAAGLTGFEVFNLHAAFDPGIRKDDLGLDPMGWLTEIGPMTSADGTAEPDLFVLAVLLEQTPSLQTWDTLLAEGPVVGTAGTDAHQNVLPTIFRDGERGDSYRRMLRWFSNVLLVDSETPGAEQQALAAGRSWVVFEILGTPSELDLHLVDASGETWELGSSLSSAGLPATLHLSCPSLSPLSPQAGDPPEVLVRVLKDGQEWAEGCGEHEVSEAGSYRVAVDMVPHHLRSFLGEDPDPWLRRYPWLLSNPVRIGLPD